MTTPITKMFQAVIGNNNASAWIRLAQGNASLPTKFTSIVASNTDSTLRVVQLAYARAIPLLTISNASPAVFTASAAHNLSVGDQIILSGTLGTGLTAGTTYFVISAGLTATAFQVSASAGGAAINTSGASSGTLVAYSMRILGSTSVAASAGFDGTVPTANLFTIIAGLAVDADAASYFYLNDASDYLYVSSTTTPAANKIVAVLATANGAAS